MKDKRWKHTWQFILTGASSLSRIKISTYIHTYRSEWTDECPFNSISFFRCISFKIWQTSQQWIQFALLSFHCYWYEFFFTIPSWPMRFFRDWRDESETYYWFPFYLFNIYKFISYDNEVCVCDVCLSFYECEWTRLLTISSTCASSLLSDPW